MVVVGQQRRGWRLGASAAYSGVGASMLLNMEIIFSLVASKGPKALAEHLVLQTSMNGCSMADDEEYLQEVRYIGDGFACMLFNMEINFFSPGGL